MSESKTFKGQGIADIGSPTPTLESDTIYFIGFAKAMK